MNVKQLSAVLTALVLLSGCTSIISESSDKPIESDPGSRTFGAVIDDHTIETTVGVNIRKADPALDTAHVVVVSYNGIVLLAGQVPTDEMRQLAADVASRVKNVKSVYNELSVGPNASVAARANDALLTTKIKSRLLGTAHIKDSRVEVTTEYGAVYLQGIVTRTEADIATDAAQNTDGVQKVVRLFEYID
jgi:osmotically-inducible protein OsmY